MEGHTSYINHLVFEPAEGKQIASVSDDHTCRLVRMNECEKAKKKYCVCKCVLFYVNDAESLDQISTLKPDTKHNMVCHCTA